MPSSLDVYMPSGSAVRKSHAELTWTDFGDDDLPDRRDRLHSCDRGLGERAVVRLQRTAGRLVPGLHHRVPADHDPGSRGAKSGRCGVRYACLAHRTRGVLVHGGDERCMGVDLRWAHPVGVIGRTSGDPARAPSGPSTSGRYCGRQPPEDPTGLGATGPGGGWSPGPIGGEPAAGKVDPTQSDRDLAKPPAAPWRSSGRTHAAWSPVRLWSTARPRVGAPVKGNMGQSPYGPGVISARWPISVACHPGPRGPFASRQMPDPRLR